MSLRINHYGDIVEPGSPAYAYSEPMLPRPELPKQPPLTAEEERQLDLAEELLRSVKHPPISDEQRRAQKLLNHAQAVAFWRRQFAEGQKMHDWLKLLRGGSR